MNVTRLIVTDASGRALYDSVPSQNAEGKFVLLEPIVQALDCNDVFSCVYENNTLKSYAASPVLMHDTVVGCVYLMEYDASQGGIIASLERTIFRGSLVLIGIIFLCAVIFTMTGSSRMRRIMTSMRLVREGEYSHKIQMRGSDEYATLAAEFNKLTDKLHDGGVWADQGVSAGCSGGLFDNITEAADILRGGSTGNGEFSLNVYPTSVPVSLALTRNGATAQLLEAGAVIKPSFCGPCFGAGDVPANNGLSLRHTTRNFPNREGSKPGEGQFAAVCLMDARSIAATAANGGRITPATDMDYVVEPQPYHFDRAVYDNRIYYGFGKADPSVELVMGPNITDWPKMYPLTENLLVELAAVIHDPVTTTDELIPSGETSSYRSNPLRLAEFTLSRRVPEYVGHAKDIAAQEAERREGKLPEHLKAVLSAVGDAAALAGTTQFGSAVFANKPGDGSAREQAASCQKVLGGFANICYSYATKRYRSNCINWGILPFTIDEGTPFDYADGDCVFVPDVRRAVEEAREDIPAKVIRKDGSVEDLMLHIRGLTQDEREIILDGCLMNYYAARIAD